MQVDAGVPVVLLGGIHAGCFELFGTERVRAIHDLKGSTVAVPGLTSPHYVFLARIAAHVGIDPKRDIKFVIYPAAESMQLLAEKKIDALIGVPQFPRSCGKRRSAMSSSTAGLTGPGRSISAASPRHIGNLSASIQWPLSGRYGQS